MSYKLLLLVGNQLGDFVLAGGQLLLVVREIAHDELALSRVQLELVHDLLEQRDVEQTVFLILSDELRRTGHDHVRDLLVRGVPVVELGPENVKQNLTFVISNRFDTHLGTMTNKVVKYSESRMKCSF